MDEVYHQYLTIFISAQQWKLNIICGYLTLLSTSVFVWIYLLINNKNILGIIDIRKNNSELLLTYLVDMSPYYKNNILWIIKIYIQDSVSLFWGSLNKWMKFIINRWISPNYQEQYCVDINNNNFLWISNIKNMFVDYFMDIIILRIFKSMDEVYYQYVDLS